MDALRETEIRRPKYSADEGPLAWQADALCAQTDPELFTPPKGGSSKAAKAICARCFSQSDCLEYAIETRKEGGIWGGLSEAERKRVAAERARAA